MYVAGVFEKLKRLFSQQTILKHSQKLVRPKNKTPKHEQPSGIIYAAQCSKECTEIYTVETCIRRIRDTVESSSVHTLDKYDESFREE